MQGKLTCQPALVVLHMTHMPTSVLHGGGVTTFRVETDDVILYGRTKATPSATTRHHLAAHHTMQCLPPTMPTSKLVLSKHSGLSCSTPVIQTVHKIQAVMQGAWPPSCAPGAWHSSGTQTNAVTSIDLDFLTHHDTTLLRCNSTDHICKRPVFPVHQVCLVEQYCN